MFSSLRTYLSYSLASALHFPSWTVLRFVGNSRWVSTAYLWIFLVPMLVRVLEKLPPEVVIVLLQQEWTIVLSLPFSWRVFYFSSVAFALGQLIYWIGCPWIIRDFSHFSHFTSEGRGGEYLERYTTWVASRPGEKHPDFYHESLKIVGEAEGSSQQLFWSLRRVTERLFPARRIMCTILYAAGLLGITWVLVENFIFVFDYLQSTSLGHD